MRFVFAGGGTGGHVFPGLAVAEALRAMHPSSEIVFLGTGRPIDREVVPANGYTLVEQSVRPVPSPKRFWRIPGFLWHWFRSKRTAAGVLDIRVRGQESGIGESTDDAPTVVLGLGGYACGPAIRVAAEKGLPAAILNPDVIPGKANVWAAKFVREIYCQWADSAPHFSHPEKVVAAGCPIRANIVRGDQAAAAREFGLDPARRTLVVTGASQGSHSINEAMVVLEPGLRRFADRWQVLHLTGRAEFESVAPRVTRGPMKYVAVPFTQRMDLVYSLADLCIGRAGAGSLAELTAAGIPSILLPYPHHADNHQRRNAEVLVRAGAAVMIEDRIDAAVNAAALEPVVARFMADPDSLSPLRTAARSLGKPDAARVIAQRLTALIS